MAWSCGIVGLPNAGKSTLFKALTALDVTIENYPFSTIDPNKAIVPIPDQRLYALAEISDSEKVTPATIEIIDVAGLVEGASRGEGLGNQFLGHLRTVDLLVHVMAGFNNLINEADDPVSRIEIVNTELSLADLEVISRRRQKTEPKLKSGDQTARFELSLLTRLENELSRGLPLRDLIFSREEKLVLDQLSLLTLKGMVYVYNISEDLLLNPDLSIFPENNLVVPMCARLEAELTELPQEEKMLFLKEYGLRKSRAEQLLEECYNSLKLGTFYTVKGSEARAWVVPAGIRAVEAAGRVHTDMERGFINVEVIAWDRLIKEGNLARAREKGFCRVEGRDYPVKDGDVLFFRFRN
jgi:ribosome-binding ATPase